MNPLLKLKQSEFGQQILLMTSGSVIAQGISFFASLLLARLYSPDSFGVFSFYISIISLLGVFGSGKYDLAIVIARSTKDAARIFYLGTLLLIAFSILITSIFFIHYFFNQNSESAKNLWLLFSGIGVLCIGFNVLLFSVYNRHQQFGILNKSRLLESIALNGFYALFFMLGQWGLLVGFLLAQLVISTYLLLQIKKSILPLHVKTHPHLQLTAWPSKKILWLTALKYQRFPRYNIVQGLLDIFQNQNFILLGAYWFSAAAIGWYSFGLRILQAPIGLLIKPMSNIFFSKTSEYHRQNISIWPLVKKTIWITGAISLPFFILFIFIGPWLFKSFFGPEWENSGVICSALSLAIWLDMIRTPISQVAIVLGKQKKQSQITLIGAITSVICLVTAGNYFEDNLAMAFFIISLGQILYCILTISYNLRLAKHTHIFSVP